MNYKDLSKTPTNEIITEMTYLERKIDLLIYKYNLYTYEICRRFPKLKKEEQFKPKVLTKDKIDI